MLGPPHLGLGHRLAERDGGGLYEPPATIAKGQRLVAPESGHDGFEREPLGAIETAGVGRVAMKLDDPILGDAGCLM